jgi:hypothetical protein
MQTVITFKLNEQLRSLRALLVTHTRRASRRRTPLLADGSFRISFAIFVFFCENPYPLP